MAKQVNTQDNTITYTDDRLNNVKTIYNVYSESSDMTFIMQDILENTTKLISTEVIGFYYGKPDINSTEQYIGSLKAKY